MREASIGIHIAQHQATVALDSREVASLILLGGLILFVLAYRQTREGAWGILKSLAGPVILIPFLGLAATTIGLVLLGRQLSLWESALVPATVAWVLSQGVVLLYKLGTRKPGEAFFGPTLARMLRLNWVVEVFIGFYVFDLVVELLLLVVLSVLAMLSAVAASEKRYRSVKRLVDGVLSIVGIGLLMYFFVSFVVNFDEVDWALVSRAFLLPFGLTLGVLPYLYLVSVWAGYRDAFMWIKFETKDRTARRRAKIGLILAFGPRVSMLGAFRHYWVKQIAEAEDVAAAREVGRDFLRNQRRRADEEQGAADRLIEYAGVEGEDEDGRRLDQREFAETKKELQWLATMQMGWYQNQGGRYRPELVEMLRPEELPDDHGIHLHVAPDGQSWWAWRRTVTGWCFAIGANEPPPNQWLYDGADPPSGFPGKDPSWGKHWGFDAKNW